MRILQKISCLITTLVVFVGVIISGQVNLSANFNNVVKAESSSNYNIEESDPIIELENSKINDKFFNLNDYRINRNGDLKSQCLMFLEYEFSIDDSEANNVNYYIYVYNPTLYPYLTESDCQVYNINHTISILIGDTTIDGNLDSKNANFKKYNMKLLTISNNGPFYKFKLDLTSEEKKDLRNKSGITTRIYNIGELDLYYKIGFSNGSLSYECDNISCGTVFTYTGYMAGCSMEKFSPSTLECKTMLRKVVSPDVNFTFYRPGGVSDDIYTQQTLHSVYFQVENKVLEEYGDLVRASAQWYDARLKPYLVTSNQETYEFANRYIGQDISGVSDFGENWADGMTCILGDIMVNGVSIAGSFNQDIGRPYYNYFTYSFGYNTNHDFSISSSAIMGDYDTNTLYLVFKSDIDAKEYTLPSELIFNEMNSYSQKTNDFSCYGYNPDLFIENKEDLELSEFKYSIYDKDINDSDYVTGLNLTNITIKDNWWKKYFGFNFVEKEEEFKITPIESIKSSDFEGVSIEDFCNKYFIDSADYVDLKNFVETKEKDDCTTFLLRYQVNDYISTNAYHCWYAESGGGFIQPLNYANRLAVQIVNLNFDVIDLSFQLNDIITVMPVAMSPQDFTADGGTALDGGSDKLINENLEKIIFLILLVILLIILWPFVSVLLGPLFSIVGKAIKLILKLAIAVVTLPFKLIKPNKRE